MSDINTFNLSTAVFLTIVGIPGNLAIILIYSSKKFRRQAMFRYYTVSIVFETVEFLFIWPFNYTQFFQLEENEFICKLVQYLSYLCFVYVSWVNVIIAVDRYFSVKYPSRFLIRKKFSFQFGILTGLFITAALIYSPFFEFDVIGSTVNETFCGVGNPITGVILDISDFFISALIPFILMILSSTLTGLYIINNKKKFNKTKLKKELKLFKILISTDLFFLFCNLPFSAYVITNDVFTLQNVSYDSMTIVYYVTDFFVFFYCSCGFFVHLICNSQFRKTLKSIFIKKAKVVSYSSQQRIISKISSL